MSKKFSRVLSPITCGYCSQKGTYETVDQHLAECPRFPLQCPKGCGESGIERCQLDQHKINCPMEELPCDFENIGCRVRLNRRGLDAHLKQDTQAHLKLMLRTETERQREKEERERQSQLEKQQHRRKVEELEGALQVRQQESEAEIEAMKVVIEAMKVEMEALKASHRELKEPSIQQARKIAAMEPHAAGPQPEHDNQQPDQEDSPHEMSDWEDHEDQFAATGERRRSTVHGGRTSVNHERPTHYDFSVRIQRSRKNNMSGPFNILEGYRLNFDMYYSGDSKAARHHKTKGISIYAYILPGDNDDQLAWPLRACLRMELVGTRGQSASEVIELDGCWNRVMWRQLDKGDHQGQDLTPFIEEAALSQYFKEVKDDVLYFRVISVDVHPSTGKQ